MVSPKRANAPKPPAIAAYVRREVLLLGKQRVYGDPLTPEEVAAIPGPGLRAMVENRDIELVGDLEGSDPGREVAQLQREVTELRRRVEVLEARPSPKVVEHFKEP